MRPNSDKVYLQQLIAEGEHQQQDFKFEISDARKIARSLSAFSNTDGGRLLIGVKDNGRIAGVLCCLYKKRANQNKGIAPARFAHNSLKQTTYVGSIIPSCGPNCKAF